MATMPKRRKSKDNPYELDYNEKEHSYTVTFTDNKQEVQKIVISKKVYEAFDKFELEDISQLHKIEKYIDDRKIDGTDDYTEIVLYHNTTNTSKTLAEEVEDKILFDELKTAINQLSEIQKRRIKMYYFEDMNLKQIAEIEGCSIKNIHKSIMGAIENLKKILKN